MTPEARKRDLERAKTVLVIFGLPMLLALSIVVGLRVLGWLA